MSQFAQQVADALRGADSELTRGFYCYGVKRVVVAADEFDGNPVASVYAVVEPEQFELITTPEGYRYPVWQLGISAYMHAILLPLMQATGAKWVSMSEPLGIARVCLNEAGLDESALADTLSLALLGLNMALEESDDCADGYFVVGESAVMAGFRGGLTEADFEGLTGKSDDDIAEVIGEPTEGDAWLAKIDELDWAEPEIHQGPVLQLTVIPEGATLPDATVLTAVKATRFGFNLFEKSQEEPGLTEVRRHLASPTATVEITVESSIEGVEVL